MKWNTQLSTEDDSELRDTLKQLSTEDNSESRETLKQLSTKDSNKLSETHSYLLKIASNLVQWNSLPTVYWRYYQIKQP